MTRKIFSSSVLMKTASFSSIFVALSLIGVKAATFFLTGSVAILSTLFDSVQDFLTSCINFFAVKHSLEPADQQHRFGHGKAQAIGSLIQAFIIGASCWFLMEESIYRFLEPKPLSEVNLGISTMVFAILITILLVSFQSYVIKKTNSISIKTDRAHYTGDVLMNLGVIFSMIFSFYFDLLWIDSLFGIGVSIYLLFVVYSVSREAISMLMDTEMPLSFKKDLCREILSFEEVHGIRSLKTRSSGNHIFVQFCVFLDENLTLKEAHQITDILEQKIRKHFPHTEIIIHPEPMALKKC